MHIFFSGIGGTGISALAVIAKQAGFEVSGSDARPSQYLKYLHKHGITDTYVGVDREHIAIVHAKKPIDWFVYGSAQPRDFPDHPEFAFCKENGIKMSLRDELLNEILLQKKLKLVAIAGTHGKTTTTAMAIWLFKQLDLPLSYSVGAKLSFGELALYDSKSQYFVYEADEYDRNFLSFYPYRSAITGIDWDHPDIYPTREAYLDAFKEFLDQSQWALLWHDDADQLGLPAAHNRRILDRQEPDIDKIKLQGRVNRENAWLIAQTVSQITKKPIGELIELLNQFPGLSRRFEEISPCIYTDYAHTPPKIRGALQLAHEAAADKVVVVYEGLHNTRQHFIKDELKHLFDRVMHLYIVPSYLAREDESLELLTPSKMLDLLSNKARGHSEAAELNDELIVKLKNHAQHGDTVLALSAGGADSLDEWLRQNFR
ncbi:MAG: Mur ligase domain-containing protein [Candidatus Saccharimonadales bacterium]